MLPITLVRVMPSSTATVPPPLKRRITGADRANTSLTLRTSCGLAFAPITTVHGAGKAGRESSSLREGDAQRRRGLSEGQGWRARF